MRNAAACSSRSSSPTSSPSSAARKLLGVLHDAVPDRRLEPVGQAQLVEIGGRLHEAEHTLVVTSVMTEAVGGHEEIGQHIGRRAGLDGGVVVVLFAVRRPRACRTASRRVARRRRARPGCPRRRSRRRCSASTKASTRRATSSSVHSPRSYNTFSASGSSGGNAVASTCSMASSALASNGAGITRLVLSHT